MWQDFIETLFKGTPYEMQVIGTPETVKSLTQKKLLDYYNKFYHPENMVLVVVGDIQLDKVEELSKKYFSLKRDVEVGIGYDGSKKVNMKSDVNKTFYANVNVEYAVLGFSTGPQTTDTVYADEVLSEILSGGEYSLLNEILKDEKNAAHLGDIIIATLPASYISDIRVRIDTFRRLAMAGTPDEVRVVKEAMEDRFGALPPEATAFCAIAELRCIAEAHGIVELATEAGTIRARRRRGDFVKIGVNFPRLSSLDPQKRFRELRDFLLRQ